MARYRLTVEYDGTPFVGWQRQGLLPTVQKALEDAFLGFYPHPVDVFGSGRTDAGVHALGQVCHVDGMWNMSPEKLQGALNAHLRPLPISVLEVCEAPLTFHARFSACERTYLYRILNRKAPSVLSQNRVWHIPTCLDIRAMEEASLCLIGSHDFTTFRASQCQARSPIKTLDSILFEKRGDELAVTLKARSFLHTQVRSLVGSLKLVGTGKWSAHDLNAALKAQDRTRCGPIAPAHGLYLASIHYPSI